MIFVDDEENSADTGSLVMLGRSMETQEAFDSLGGTIDVTIALMNEKDRDKEVGTSVST